MKSYNNTTSIFLCYSNATRHFNITKVQSLENKRQLFLTESRRSHKGNRRIKTLSSSATRVLLWMFFPLSIFVVIYHMFYKPRCAVQLLNETKRQVEAGGDLRTITVIQESEETRCQPRAPIREALNVKLDVRVL